MYIYLITVALVGFVLLLLKRKSYDDYEMLSQYFVNKNWKRDETAELDQSVHKFEIKISDDDISYLNHRLDITRFPLPSIPTSKFHYGIRDDYMRSFVEYWKKRYSWHDQESMMNKFDHFKTNIEGLNVHFIHQKPKESSRGIQAKTIIVTHGWPGSFVEYLEVIKRLTSPKDYGANETEAFNVVCPSIPGYGFSDAAEKEGFNYFECARVFHKLMLRLGYKHYYVAGGDWGSAVSMAMALMYPSYVTGCYTTLCVVSPLNIGLFKSILAYYFPWLFYTHEERLKIFPVKKMLGNFLQESGYFHLQATKPDTIGFSLSDSPVGLAAYILEKFSTWTDVEGRSSNNGLLDQYWSRDQLLNNIMIYWLSGNITSSMRFYKENMSSSLHELAPLKVRVPSGFGCYPGEFLPSAKCWVESKYSNLMHFTYMRDGGHFSSYQCPDAFTEDVRIFVRKVGEIEYEQRSIENAEVKGIRSSHLDRYEIGDGR